MMDQVPQALKTAHDTIQTSEYGNFRIIAGKLLDHPFINWMSDWVQLSTIVDQCPEIERSTPYCDLFFSCVGGRQALKYDNCSFLLAFEIVGHIDPNLIPTTKELQIVDFNKSDLLTSCFSVDTLSPQFFDKKVEKMSQLVDRNLLDGTIWGRIRIPLYKLDALPVGRLEIFYTKGHENSPRC